MLKVATAATRVRRTVAIQMSLGVAIGRRLRNALRDQNTETAIMATPAQVAFMIRHTSGILCTPLPADDAARLRLTPAGD